MLLRVSCSTCIVIHWWTAMEENARRSYRSSLLILSILVNIVLVPVAGYIFLQNSSLEDQVLDLSSSLNELTESSMILEQQLNMSMTQLDYYKKLADYYSGLVTPGEDGAGVFAQSTIPIVAVRTIQSGFRVEYEGVVMEADIEFIEGDGRILVDTVPNIGIDIQTSVRTAVLVAQELTGISLSNTDLILTVRASEEVQVVDGQSAGAAITIAILAALTNQTVKQGVYMTGTINRNGSIGAVGGIAAKALAAAEKDSEWFLVPEGQSTIIVYKPTTYEIFPGWSRTVYQQETMELEDYLQEQGYSIIVEEVETIEDAYALFFDQPSKFTLS